MKLISFVVPVYNEALSLNAFLTELQNAVTTLPYRFEVIFVDDGSIDKSWSILKDCSLADRSKKELCIRAFKLSRNFGKEAAIRLGLEKAVGDGVIVIDADLQQPPALIPEMLSVWQDQSVLIVECRKKSRESQSGLRSFFNTLYFNLFKLCTGFTIRDTSDFKLLDRTVVDAMVKLPERSPFFRGLTLWLGFSRRTLEFDVPESVREQSQWGFCSLARLSIESVVSFSAIPLYIIPISGVLFLFFALILGLNALYQWLSGVAIEGFTTVILLLLIIGGLILTALGIIGIYLAQIYNQSQARPRYVIEAEL